MSNKPTKPAPATDEMRDKARECANEVKLTYGYCCNEGGTNLAIGPETLAEILEEFASQILQQAEQRIAKILRFESADDPGEWFIPAEPGPLGPWEFPEVVQEFMNFMDREFSKADHRAEAAEQRIAELEKALADEKLESACARAKFKMTQEFREAAERERDEARAALKIAAIWAPHNHEPNQDNNGHCPKCNADAILSQPTPPGTKGAE